MVFIKRAVLAITIGIPSVLLSIKNSSLGLKELSIGMSADYMKAVNYKATYLRLGSSIFGERS